MSTPLEMCIKRLMRIPLDATLLAVKRVRLRPVGLASFTWALLHCTGPRCTGPRCTGPRCVFLVKGMLLQGGELIHRNKTVLNLDSAIFDVDLAIGLQSIEYA